MQRRNFFRALAGLPVAASATPVDQNPRYGYFTPECECGSVMMRHRDYDLRPIRQEDAVFTCENRYCRHYRKPVAPARVELRAAERPIPEDPH